jgi:hypothetical protein
MKRIPRWLYRVAGLALIAVVAIVALRQPATPPVASSRFALMAPVAQNAGQESPPGALAEVSAERGPVVIKAEKFDTSPALASIPPISPVPQLEDAETNELNILPGRDTDAFLNNQPTDFKDPVLQEGELSSNISAPLQNFDGVNNVNGVLPPDTNGDVGPNHYVQWVNLSFAIYSKTGSLLYGPAAGNTLWSGFGGPCQTTNNGDPIVQYDHLADRWMMSQFAFPNYPSGPFYQCIAVSQTANPTGAWYRYQFQISASKLNDYPHFGVWSDGYYMSINQFVGNSWGGAGAVVFDRKNMLLGQSAQAVYFDLYGVDPNLGGMLPADLDGPAPADGTPNYFVEADDNGAGFPQDQLQIWQFHVDWTTPGNSTFTQTGILPTAAFDSNMCGGGRNCIPQQGTSVKLDAIADRMMYRLQYRNFGTYQTMVANHTVDVNSSDRAGIRWYELRNSGSGWSIYQQGSFSPDASHRWMGSAAMDGNGNIGLGYSASSSTSYAAIRYTGRLAGDPLGTLPQGEGTIITGTGAQTHSASRWGDYSMLAVDPVDNCTFWFTSEYIQTTGSATWRTRIGSFQLPGCGGPTPTPTNTPVPPTPTNTPVPPTPTNTPVPPTPTNTPAPISNTGFLTPSANAAETSSAGDNNGYQTSPTSAYATDGIFAVDTNSGTNSNTSCTNSGKDKHRFYAFNINTAGMTAIQGIEIRLNAKVDSSSNAPKICVQLSWNGGTTWTTAKSTATLTTGVAGYVLGGAADTWGRAWTTSDLSNTNFRVRVIDVASSTARDFSLDGIAVQVSYN